MKNVLILKDVMYLTHKIMRLRNANHVTEENWKYHGVKRLEWYEDKIPV